MTKTCARKKRKTGSPTKRKSSVFELQIDLRENLDRSRKRRRNHPDPVRVVRARARVPVATRLYLVSVRHPRGALRQLYRELAGSLAELGVNDGTCFPSAQAVPEQHLPRRQSTNKIVATTSSGTTQRSFAERLELLLDPRIVPGR